MEDKKYIKKLYKKYIDNSITTKEWNILLDYWKKSEDENKLGLLREALKIKFDTRPVKGDVDLKGRDKFLDNLMSKVNEAGETSPTPLHIPKKKDHTWHKVAAVVSIAIIASLSVYYFTYKPVPEEMMLVYQTVSRQKSTITLSDGTTIRLNAKSKLEYPENFQGQVIREVILEGEAFFDVVPNPGMPFVVRSGGITTKVLGTSFNISAYPEDSKFEVAVATGKVAVATGKNGNEEKSNELVLEPNEVANYNLAKGSLLKETKDVNDLIAWKDDVMVFNDKTIEEVAHVLERWYDVQVIIESEELKNCLFRGRFIDPSIKKVLEALKFMYKIEYELSNEQVLLRGPGCD